MCILFLLENRRPAQHELISWYSKTCLSSTEDREGWKGKEAWIFLSAFSSFFPSSLDLGEVAGITYSNIYRHHNDMMQVAWTFSFLEQHCFLWEESSSLKPECDLLEMSGSRTCNGRNAMLVLLPCGILMILRYPLESYIRRSTWGGRTTGARTWNILPLLRARYIFHWTSPYKTTSSKTE